MSPPHAGCGNINVNKIHKVSCLMEPTVLSGEMDISSASPESITDFINAVKERKERNWVQ